ncbi:MAG: hypothetical protein K5751_02795 [Treponemataceae bacterium]|nr:hypothetical protein [Treponemataceae bacterium]
MKKSIFMFTTAILTFIVPLPSRFAYTLIILLTVNFVMLSGTALKMFIGKLDLQNLEPMLLVVFMISMTILFKQFIILYSPIIAFTIGFVIYLAPVSSFLTGHILEPKENYNSNLFAVNMRNSGIISGIAGVIAIIREFLAYGSFSLPFRDGIHIYKYPFVKADTLSFFFSTISGALILTGLFVALFFFINRKIEIARRKD